MRAIEYVSGKYYPETEAVVLDGYRKDDPNGIWESDKLSVDLVADPFDYGRHHRGT